MAHDLLESAIAAAAGCVRAYLAKVQRVCRAEPHKLAAMGAAVRARRQAEL